MLDQQTINTIAMQVTIANLSSANVTRVFSSPSTDLDGRDALQITIVLAEGGNDRLPGRKTVDTLVELQDELLG
jgi:hypothetical protein